MRQLREVAAAEAAAHIATPAVQPPAEVPAPYGLTGRELAVLRLVAAGRTNAEIGAELYISPKTAGVHVSNILRKLGVSGRVQAAALAERAGLLRSAQPYGVSSQRSRPGARVHAPARPLAVPDLRQGELLQHVPGLRPGGVVRHGHRPSTPFGHVCLQQPTAQRPGRSKHGRCAI